MTALTVSPVACSIDYPDGPMADALEAQISQSLPAVEGLSEAETQAERMMAYDCAIRKQFKEFVDLYGDPFGWEKRQVTREESAHHRQTSKRQCFCG